MRAVVIAEPGQPDVMQWLEVPDPVPGPSEVVIGVAAAGADVAVSYRTVDFVAAVQEVAAAADRELPTSQAAAAHQAMAASEHVGKVLPLPS